MFDDYSDMIRESRPQLAEMSRTSWVLRMNMTPGGATRWETLLARTDERGFPRLVTGAATPRSGRPTPEHLLSPPIAKDTSVPQPAKAETGDVMVKLDVVSERPGATPVNEMTVYTLDEDFLQARQTMKNPQETAAYRVDRCELRTYDYNTVFEYPDPHGFDTHLKEVELRVDNKQRLRYPMTTWFRDFPQPLFDFAGTAIHLIATASSPADSFSSQVQGISAFDVKTDANLVPGQDFSAKLTGKTEAERLQINFGGYNSSANVGYHVACDFPARGPFVIPGALTKNIPTARVPQSEVSLEFIGLRETIVKKPRARIISSHRAAVTVPLRVSQ